MTQPSLDPNHLVDLRKSGLSDEMIEIMGVYSARPDDIQKILDFNPKEVESALVFPYLDVDGFYRIKSFRPFKDSKGHIVRYLQRKDSAVHLYILPPVKKVLPNHSIPIYFTEGEKKHLISW